MARTYYRRPIAILYNDPYLLENEQKKSVDSAVLDSLDAFICALRENRLRIAPHFYNTEDEIERFCAALQEA